MINNNKEYPVNLPKTTFPMKADLAKREPEVLEKWKGLYEEIRLKNIHNKKSFILHDGPPYANGPIHLGHALNKILKDIIIKSKNLSGYNAPYIPGWDCHGLPIELEVEKKYGKAMIKISKEDFMEKCREYAAQQIEIQKKAFIRLGILGDWNHHYATMNPKYEADIIRALGKVIANGFLEKGYKPVHWCTVCGSALAEAEVEYKDKTSPAIDVRFRFINLPKAFAAKVKSASVPIWTTTPWTLPANEAVALNANIEYVLVACRDFSEPLLIAEALLTSCMQRYGVEDYKIIVKCLGKDLEDPTKLEEKTFLQHPFLDKKVPIIVGDHVTIETGTGAVHTAPAHGQEDFKIAQEYTHKYKKYIFTTTNPVSAEGCFIKGTPFFAGEHVLQANEHVIAILKEKGNLIHTETLQHSYPHCWRHKTPLIFRATPQWFISMDNNGSLRTKAEEAARNVKWFPEYGKDRMLDMLENRPDWCLSRQRLWCTPMPLFIHKDEGTFHPQLQKLIGLVANQVEKEGIIFWHNLDTEQFLKEHAKEDSAENYIKVTDTLDVWFDSGVSHFCVLDQKADLYIEGSDQYRGWFQSSLLTSVAINNVSPYEQVVTHGFTIDEKGYKMSKSLGNVIDPHKIINTNGADILRLWVASVYYPDDVALSDEILKGVIDVYRRIRNTVRYLLSNLDDFDPSEDLLKPKDLLALDCWAIQEAINLQDGAKVNYEKYEFYGVYDQIRIFTSTTMGNYYLDIIKDRLYTMKPDSIGRRSAQTALYHILEILVRVLAPILSFTAEEIWQQMRQQFKNKRENSIFLTEWHLIESDKFEKDLIMQDDWVHIHQTRISVYKELEKIRAGGKIGSSLDAEVKLFCSEKIFSSLKKLRKNDNESELRFILITSYAAVLSDSERPTDAVKAENLNSLWIKVNPSQHSKCIRCWHHREDVGENHEHPELCGRCISNLFGESEERNFA